MSIMLQVALGAIIGFFAAISVEKLYKLARDRWDAREWSRELRRHRAGCKECQELLLRARDNQGHNK